MNRGGIYAAGAYLVWGLLPIFWKALQHVPAAEILAHRIAWACLFTCGLLIWRRQLDQLPAALRRPRVLGAFALSALLLSLNWFVYIWAVNAGYVVETSLGYFINPLVSVALGMLFLGERLRAGQLTALVLALGGVLYLTLLYGTPPWIALALAGSFGLYGLLRKTASLESLTGLTLETLLMTPLALAYLLLLEVRGAALGHTDPLTLLLLSVSGLVTAVPLLLFAAGARRIRLTTLGLLQYIAPTMQFALGVLLYGEELSGPRLFGFSLIWLALAIYSLEGVWYGRRLRVEG